MEGTERGFEQQVYRNRGSFSKRKPLLGWRRLCLPPVLPMPPARRVVATGSRLGDLRLRLPGGIGCVCLVAHAPPNLGIPLDHPSFGKAHSSLRRRQRLLIGVHPSRTPQRSRTLHGYPEAPSRRSGMGTAPRRAGSAPDLPSGNHRATTSTLTDARLCLLAEASD